MHNTEVSTVSVQEDIRQLGEILRQCFSMPASYWPVYAERLGAENLRVVRRAGQIAGGLGIYRMGQWFGGKSLPMAGLAAVGVAPEHRGTGVAATLLAQTLEELHGEGIPLSGLYASTQNLYRKVGYEQAGHLCRFSVPASSLIPGEHGLSMEPVNPARHEVFHLLYTERARATNGNLDRNRAVWERLVLPKDTDDVRAYLLGPTDQPEGYLIYSQQTTGSILRVWDLTALTPAAMHRIWTFFADHRSLVDEVVWPGPVCEPFLTILPEQTYRIVHLERWMLRIVDVPGALSRRGYPVGVEAELHLEVRDDLLAANRGRFVLKVSEGQSEVIAGGRGEMQLSVRGLVPLYTGLQTPYQLQSTGHLDATPAALASAARLFSGPEPWMSDHF